MLRTITLITLIATAMAVPVLFSTKECTLWDMTTEPKRSIDLQIMDSYFHLRPCNQQSFKYTIDQPQIGDITFSHPMSTRMMCLNEKKKILEDQYQDLLLAVKKYIEKISVGSADTVFLQNGNGKILLAVTKRGQKPAADGPKNDPMLRVADPVPKAQTQNPAPVATVLNMAETFPQGYFLSYIPSQIWLKTPTDVNATHFIFYVCSGKAEITYHLSANNGIRFDITAESENICKGKPKPFSLLQKLKNVTNYKAPQVNQWLKEVYLNDKNSKTLINMVSSYSANNNFRK